MTTTIPGETAPPARLAALTIEIPGICTGDPDCVTVKAWPPTVTVPVLDAPSGFASAEMPTTPAPDPEAPVTIVIHIAVLVAVQAQLAGAETL